MHRQQAVSPPKGAGWRTVERHHLKEEPMSIQNTPIRPPSPEGVKTPGVSRKTLSTLVGGPSPFANVMAQESQAKAAAMQLGAVDGNLSGTEKMNVFQAQTMAQANMDLKRTHALNTLAQTMEAGDSPLDSARNAVAMRNLRTVVGGFNLKAPVMPMADSIKAQAMQGALRMGRVSRSAGRHQAVTGGGVGKLAAQFESGSDGIAAVGYDRHGGTSYGKYQIASRVGSMDNFLKFMDTAAPDLSKRLRGAGPANTGSRQGAMPDEWRKIAAEQPDRFEALQEKFIHDSHYVPALEAVTKSTALQEGHISSAMQEVIWSTAVQHGPAGAARIFGRAAERIGQSAGRNYDQKLIDSVYALRAEQFGSSTAQVQSAVRNRLQKEKQLALGMLGGKGGRATA